MTDTRAHHRRIAQATLVVGLYVLVSRLAMLGREVVISWKYGASQVTDAYQLALGLSTWLPMAIVSVFVIVLVPEFVRKQGGDPVERRRLFSEVNGLALALGVAIAALSALVFPALVPLVGGALPDETKREAASMTLMLAPVAGLMVVASVLSCRLMARERHVNTLLEALPPLAICVAVFAWSEHAGLDLTWGLVAGTLLQTIWLAALVARGSDGLAAARVGFASPSWPALWHAAGVMAAGQMLLTLATPVEQYFAARVGEGAVATLGYANRMFTLVASLGALAISRGVLPVLSDVATKADGDHGRHLAHRWALLMGAGGLAVALIGWVVTPLAVTVLFERGAFRHEDTLAVAEAVRWGLAQFPFYFAGIVLVQYLVVRGRYRAIAGVAVANLVVKALSAYVLAPVLGVPGITLGTAIMYLSSCAIFALMARRM